MLLPILPRPKTRTIQKQAHPQGGRNTLERDLAAGATVPFRSAAFRPSPLRPFARRKLRGSLHLPCPLHLPGLLLVGLLHCPPHLLVSLLSVDLTHRFGMRFPKRNPLPLRALLCPLPGHQQGHSAWVNLNIRQNGEQGCRLHSYNRSGQLSARVVLPIGSASLPLRTAAFAGTWQARMFRRRPRRALGSRHSSPADRPPSPSIRNSPRRHT